MKVKLIILISIFLFCTSNAQEENATTLEIEFQESLRVDLTKITFQGLNVLRSNGNSSVFNFVKRIHFDMPDNNFELDSGNSDNSADVYKSYERNELFSKDIVGLRYFTIKDSLNIFNWNLDYIETKEIFGFKCSKATMEFRGRNYVAWYASDLIAGGPWKFDGLPGMILEIESLDRYIKYEAIKIKKSKDLNLIKNPFKDEKKYLSWSEFKELYLKKAIATAKYSYESNATKYGETESIITVPRMRTECYIEEDDLRYKADLKVEEMLKRSGNQ